MFDEEIHEMCVGVFHELIHRIVLGFYNAEIEGNKKRAEKSEKLSPKSAQFWRNQAEKLKEERKRYLLRHGIFN